MTESMPALVATGVPGRLVLPSEENNTARID